MKKKKENIIDSISYSTKKDALLATSLIIAVLSVFASLLYAFVLKTEALVILITLGLVFAVSLIIFCVGLKAKNVRPLSVFLTLVVSSVAMPVFIRYGAETQSTSPLWYAASFFVMIFLLELNDLWWIFTVSLYVGAFVYIKTFLEKNSSRVINDRVSFFIGFALTFIAIVIAVSLVVLRIEKSIGRAESEIEKSKAIQKQAGLVKTRFLANMTTEIRTPMNSVIGISELLLKEEIDDATKNKASIIRQSSYDLLEIIDDVLMYSKLDSGKFKLVYGDFKFDDVLKNVVNVLTSNSAAKNIKVRMKVDHDIPKIINSDEIQIKQVLMRLVFISLSLTDNGRIMIEAAAKRNENNDKAVITCSVLDTGCGLSDIDLGAIFGTYDIYDSRQNSNLKGIGLKFSICREILKLMNGDLEIHSIEGVGLESKMYFECDIVNPEPIIKIDNTGDKKVLIYARDTREYAYWKNMMDGFKLRPDYVDSYFTFETAMRANTYNYIFVQSETYPSIANVIDMYRSYDNTYIIGYFNNSYGDFNKCRIIRHPVSSLNLSSVLNNQWNAEEYISKSQNETYDGSKAKILVVDDSSVNLKVAQGIFRSYKIEIDTAKSGNEALKMLEDKEYHLVFLDMVMPELNGDETLALMRKSGNSNMTEVPVIALTANTGTNIREEVLEKGFQEYVAKPIKQRYLTQALIQFLPKEVFKKVTVSDDNGATKISISNVKESGRKETMSAKLKELFESFKKAVSELDLKQCVAILSDIKNEQADDKMKTKIDEISKAYDLYDFKKINDILNTI